MKAFLSKYVRGDKGIWAIAVTLCVFSLLAIYSSKGQRGTPAEYTLIKQFGFVLGSLAVMFVAHRIKYTYYSRISQILLFLVVPLLIVTFIIGIEGRWLNLGFMTFQTSDLAKLALVMYVSRVLTKCADVIKERSTFWKVMIPTLLCCALILPGNLSTTILLFSVIFCLMFFAKIRSKYMLQTIGVGVLALVILVSLPLLVDTSNWRIRVDTWSSRVMKFFSPEETELITQSDEAKAAISSSSFIGKMPGNSVQRNFLTQSDSDFIYAIILEEYGLFVGVIILMCYLWLLYRSIRIAIKCEGAFGSYMVIGISLLITFQALINMSVAIGLMPVTGQPLPLVSSGGSSLLCTCIGIGIILSVSAEVENKSKLKEIDEASEIVITA